jgi:hypothetical protein
VLVEVSSVKREVTAQGLSPGTRYEFTLTAESPGGVVATSAASATTPPVAES